MIEKKDVDFARLELLKQCADQIAIRFLSPIYLVGSYIDFPDTAKDIDILMVTTEDRFYRLFESSEFNDRQFEFRKKQKLDFETYINDRDIDFKVVTITKFIAVKGKRIKLDKIMEFPE